MTTSEKTNTGNLDTSKVFDFVKPGYRHCGDDVQKIFAVAKENNFALPAVNWCQDRLDQRRIEAAAKSPCAYCSVLKQRYPYFIAGKGVFSWAKASSPLFWVLFPVRIMCIRWRNITACRSFCTPIHCAKLTAVVETASLDAGENTLPCNR